MLKSGYVYYFQLVFFFIMGKMLQETGISFKHIACARHFELQKYKPLHLSRNYSSVSEKVLFSEVFKRQI